MLKLVIAAAHALNKGHRAGDRFVRGTNDFPFLPKHALKLESGNHVPVDPVTIAGSAHRIESLKTTCYDDCVSLARCFFRDLAQANRILRALVLTNCATLVLEIQAVGFINRVKRHVVLGVAPDNGARGRAFLKTYAAICTFLRIDMERFADKAVRESAVAVYALELCIQVNSNPGFLNYLQESLFHRTGAALLTLVSSLAAKLNGMTAKEASLFHQFHINIQLCQFPCGCQAGNASTDDQDLLGCLTRRILSMTLFQK
jgi:hypothetical protein